MPEHVDIVDPEIHETKGIAAASAGQVQIADGLGSGSWAKIGTTSLDGSSIFDTNKFSLTVKVTDVSTAESILVPLPFACTLNRVTSVLHGAISGADTVLTFTNSTGPSAMGTMTIAQSGSAEGDIDTFTPSANSTFSANTYVKIACDGASTGTAAAILHLEFTRTAA